MHACTKILENVDMVQKTLLRILHYTFTIFCHPQKDAAKDASIILAGPKIANVKKLFPTLTTFSPIFDLKSSKVAFFYSKWKDDVSLISLISWVYRGELKTLDMVSTLTNEIVGRLLGNEQLGIRMTASCYLTKNQCLIRCNFSEFSPLCLSVSPVSMPMLKISPF